MMTRSSRSKVRDRLLGFTLLLLLSVALSAGHGFARMLSDSEIRDRIREQLAQRHPSDTPEFWRELGPSAPRVIEEMLAQSKSTYERVRLFEGLGWFDTEESKQAIRSAAESEQNRSLLRTELRSLLRTPGDSAKDEVEFVEKFMDREDPNLRAQIGEILAESGSPEALRAIERRIEKEKTSWVADRLRRSQSESRARAERERLGTGEWTVAGRRNVPVLQAPGGASAMNLDPAFDGRWEGRWIGVRVNPGKEGVLVRTLSVAVTREKGDSAKTGATVLSRLKISVPGLTPYAPSGAVLVLSGSGVQAEGVLDAASVQALTVGLEGDSSGAGKMTVTARLVRTGGQAPALALESGDGRQHWLFTKR